MSHRHEEGWAQTADGLSLYWQSWSPEAVRKGVLLFVHGLAEHSGRYRNPADYFVPRGWACYALDYRGHGRSPGKRVHVLSIDEFVGDVRTFHQMVRDRHRGVPVFLVGHSQGGLIVLRYALAAPDGLPGIVVNSPLLGIHPSARPSALLAWAGRVLVKVAPAFLIGTGLDPRAVSRDPTVVAAYAADPLVSRKTSVGWFRALGEAQAEALARAGELRVPALVMSAGADRLVDVDAARRFVARAPAALVEYEVWDGLYHESFNEPEKEQVFRRMETWLESRVASTT